MINLARIIVGIGVGVIASFQAYPFFDKELPGFFAGVIAVGVGVLVFAAVSALIDYILHLLTKD